jgi:hypothetical protein
MGRNSVDATKVLRICAVRAIRSALVARLPLLVGLCRLDLLLADVLVLPVFAFVLLAWPVLLLAVLAPLDVGRLLLEVVCFAAGFWSSEDWPAIGNTIRKASTAAMHRIAGETRRWWRKKALMSPLYLYLCQLDAREPLALPLRPEHRCQLLPP